MPSKQLDTYYKPRQVKVWAQAATFVSIALRAKNLWFQRLKLKHGELHSSLALNVNLRP
jgi:hypothetical protein